MDFKIKRRDPINVIGVKLHVPEADQAPYQIGQFWEKFRSEKTKDKIPNKVHPDQTIAVYTNYGPQGEGYSLIIGAEVQYIVNNVPDGMVGIEIPEQVYGIFSAQGAIPQIVKETWEQVWKAPIPREYTYDFEIYKNESLDSADVDFYIAVKPDYMQAG